MAGDIDKHAGIVSFNLKNYAPHDVAVILDMHNICVRSGYHCAILLHKELNLKGSVRASFHCYNTIEEIHKMLDILEKL